MGLIHPRDYAAWAAREKSRHRARRLKNAVVGKLRPVAPEPWVIHQRGDAPVTLIALDVTRGTSFDALISPIAHTDAPVAVVTRGAWAHGLAGDWTSQPIDGVHRLPTSVRTVLSAGSFEAVSLPVHRWATERGIRFVVVQHGLLTPYAPPLPEGSVLAAWTEADAAFWAEGRDDITQRVVGSQLLWRAAQRRVEPTSERPVFLGQLHGTELSTRDVERVSREFCRRTGAEYRAHPGEQDVMSRSIHRVWQRLGIEFEGSGLPLADLGRPVVSIFSTGVLEAAVQGLPAWGFHPRPPAWLEEFWDRNRFGRWGQRQTVVEAPDSEPAQELAERFMNQD